MTANNNGRQQRQTTNLTTTVQRRRDRQACGGVVLQMLVTLRLVGMWACWGVFAVFFASTATPPCFFFWFVTVRIVLFLPHAIAVGVFGKPGISGGDDFTATLLILHFMLGVAVLIFGIVQIAVFDSDERFCARGSTAFYYGTLPLVVCEITFNLLIFTTILLIWCEHCFKHHANVDGMYFDYCGLLALLRTPRLVRQNQRTVTEEERIGSFPQDQRTGMKPKLYGAVQTPSLSQLSSPVAAFAKKQGNVPSVQGDGRRGNGNASSVRQAERRGNDKPRCQPITLDDLLEDQHPRECCICQATFNMDKAIVVTECNHVFHRECFVNWWRRSRTCPTCRTVVRGRN